MDLYWSWVPGLPRKLYWPVRVISWDGLKVKVFCKADNAILQFCSEYYSKSISDETDINENADDPMIDAGEPKDDEGVSKTIKSENCCIYDRQVALLCHKFHDVLMKRVLLYDSSIRHFVEYFKKKDKVVTIDVSCGVPEIIWTTVLDFFGEYDLIPSTVNETVIIYAFDSSDLDEINIGLYSLTVISLNKIVIDPNGDAIELIDQLCRYIDNTNDSTRHVFVVDCSGTSLSKNLSKKKSRKMIQFTDSGSECRMGKYCSVNLTEKEDPAELRAVVSIENEVCLFVQSTPEDLCKWIAQVMVDVRKKRMKS